MANEWDIAEIIAEVAEVPTESVSVYTNQNASYEMSQLKEMYKEKQISEERLAELEDAKEQLQALLEASKYTFNITGISSAQRDSISRKARANYPQKVSHDNFMMEDPAQVELRNEYETLLCWTAQVQSIVNPAGKVNEDFDEAGIKKIIEALPAPARNAVSTSIRELNAAMDRFTVEHKDPLF